MVDRNNDVWLAEVFVSHTSLDSPYCRVVVLPAIEAVVERNFNQHIFMDWNNFGRMTGEQARVLASGYVKEITRLISSSRSFLVVLSTAAIRSQWVAWEVNWWLTNRSIEKMIVVLAEKCDPLDLDTRLDKANTVFLPTVAQSEARHRLQTELKIMLE